MKKDKGSTERFGYEWKTYSKITPEYKEQFVKWIYPLELNDFKDKKVLDAGCGIGRNSLWPLIYGAKEVTSFDYNKNSVEAAKKNLARFKNSEVFYNSIYDINYNDEFDISFSIGVIHHLEFPEKAVHSLINATKPNGIILIWVYGYEGNEWIVRYINPIRKITSKLPVGLTHFLTYFCSTPLYFYIKIFKPKHKYLKQLSKFKFWHIHSIAFDQLIPKIANYWTKKQALDLFNHKNIKDIKIFRVNNNSWTVIARKK